MCKSACHNQDSCATLSSHRIHYFSDCKCDACSSRTAAGVLVLLRVSMQGSNVAESLAVRYTRDLVVVPIANALCTWRTDELALADTAALVGGASEASMAIQRAAADMQLPSGATGSQLALPVDSASQLPHCKLQGIVCNAQGRIVHVDGPALGLAQGKGSKRAFQILQSIMRLPWLVALSMRGLQASGELPRAADMPQPLPLVRLQVTSSTLVVLMAPSEMFTCSALLTCTHATSLSPLLATISC